MLQDAIREFPLYLIFLEIMYILTLPCWAPVFRQISVLKKRPTNKVARKTLQDTSCPV
jgi:hypothetical protein